MNKFNYEMAIAANSETEADTKMKALTVFAAHISATALTKLAASVKNIKSLIALSERLTENELAKLADIVTNDPIKTAMAKQALGVN